MDSPCVLRKHHAAHCLYTFTVLAFCIVVCPQRYIIKCFHDKIKTWFTIDKKVLCRLYLIDTVVPSVLIFNLWLDAPIIRQVMWLR